MGVNRAKRGKPETVNQRSRSNSELSDQQEQAADVNFRTKEGRKSFWTNIVAVWLGTTMEYVDFALYGLASGLVFGDIFFPGQTPVIALLS